MAENRHGESGAGFFVHRTTGGRFTWWLSLEEAITVARSDREYDTEEECIAAVQRIQREAPTAHVYPLREQAGA